MEDEIKMLSELGDLSIYSHDGKFNAGIELFTRTKGVEFKINTERGHDHVQSAVRGLSGRVRSAMSAVSGRRRIEDKYHENE